MKRDTLNCDPGIITDADGAVLFDYAYARQVNGVDVVETSYALDGDAFDRDDEVVLYHLNDGVDDGDAVNPMRWSSATPCPTSPTWKSRRARPPSPIP